MMKTLILFLALILPMLAAEPTFPKHWGNPPQIQTRDLVTLSKPYGKGSSTLRTWISKNQKKDNAKKKKLRATGSTKTTLKIPASSIPAKGGFYLDQGQWLAINIDHKKEAEVKVDTFFMTGKFKITLETVGDIHGTSNHEIFHKGKRILDFTVPLAGKDLEIGPRFQKTTGAVQLSLLDQLTVRSKANSTDGQTYSRGRIAAIYLTALDDEAHQKIADQKKGYDPPELPNKIAHLQDPRQPNGDGSILISNALTQWNSHTNAQWQPITLTLDGPFAHELDLSPNPFRDYSLVVTFTHSSGAPEYHVPGYFAADGNAAETSAKSGTKWRAHFSPDLPGEWTYNATFLAGKDVAFESFPYPSKPFDMIGWFSPSGKITVGPTPENAPGFYAEGRLTYVGKHYLQFAGSKRYFLKAGADAPETLLGYVDFDDTTASTKKVPLKTFTPHVRDWQKGDPTWQDGKGKGLIGALNYLSGKGMNAFSFLPYNAGGDGDNVWPFVSRDQKFHYDCSKLDQWNIVFTHAQAKGLFLHFKLQETEMDDNKRGHGKNKKSRNVPTSLDGGDLGPKRTLYCREIVARFGHHLALNWNLGEENTQTTKQQAAMARCLRDYDPYDHHLVIHTYPNEQDKVYKPLLGADDFTGVSLQNSHLKDVHWQTVKWRRQSATANHPWCVAFDEPGDAQFGMPPDSDYPGMPKNYQGPSVDQTRKWVLWGNLLGGGWGVEYYFGYKLPQNDLVCEDWRSRDQSWDYAKIALDFFQDQKIPFWEMSPQPEAVGNPDKGNKTYCLAGKDLYLLAFPDGGTCELTVSKNQATKTIQWFNPRNGKIRKAAPLKSGKITCPDKKDWVAIIRFE